MSAFIVGDYHINYIVSYSIKEKITKPNSGGEYYTREELAALLLAENVRSVNARYSNHPAQTPDPVKVQHVPDTSGIQVLKALDCLEYQSCETEDYRQSEAFRVADHIRGMAIRRLPGYEEADWEITPEARDRRVKEIKDRIRAELNLKA